MNEMFHGLGVNGISDKSLQIIINLGVVVLGGVTLAIIGLILHRLFSRAPDIDQAFTLSDLRRMRNEGQITSDEYEKTKATLLAKQGITTADHRKSGSENHRPDV